MTARTMVLALSVAAGAVALSACGLVKEGAKAISEQSTVPGQTAPANGGGNANAVACVTERQEIQLAVDSYEILRGGLPTTEAELVPDFLLHESTLFDITPEGQVVPAPGSGC